MDEYIYEEVKDLFHEEMVALAAAEEEEGRSPDQERYEEKKFWGYA